MQENVLKILIMFYFVFIRDFKNPILVWIFLLGQQLSLHSQWVLKCNAKFKERNLDHDFTMMYYWAGNY